MLEQLKLAVYEAHMELPKRGLVTYTWGNVSGIDREKGLVVIKPSGVEYEELTPDMLVVLNLALWLYAACRCLQGAFALSDIRILLPIAAVLAFSVSMLGRDVEVLAGLQSFAGLLQWIACAGLIPILAIVAAIRCKGGKMP